MSQKKKKKKPPRIPDVEAGPAEETVAGDSPKDEQKLGLPKRGPGLERLF